MSLLSNGLTIEVCNSEIIYQGDIILDDDQLEILLSDDKEGENALVETRASIIKDQAIQTKFYYKISIDRLNHRNLIELVRQGVAEWQRALPFMQFIEITGTEPCYINFIYGDDTASSKIGRNGGKQDIKIPHWANRGTVIHELGHSLGLIHEHCRRERNEEIIVYYDNIEKKKRHNYDIVNKKYNLISTVGTSQEWNGSFPFIHPTPTLNQKLDFNSIMMYPSYGGSFAINPSRPVMMRKIGNSNSGRLHRINAQRDYISQNDRLVVYYLYKINPMTNQPW